MKAGLGDTVAGGRKTYMVVYPGLLRYEKDTEDWQNYKS
jgi:hypothetical protein